ncbi:MAG: acyltransferase [Limnothrix sp. RL_2_0]|nr:acyltransferase [Limnothrix sp. RL_2_0]
MIVAQPKPRARIYGVDLFRCVAILGVVILHTNPGAEVHPNLWQRIREISSFAVPYFLSASFFLAIQTEKPFDFFKRIKRVLLPYLFWSILYCLFHLFIYVYTGNYETFLEKYISDPFGIFFLGAASFHLWFLPLLLTGNVLISTGNIYLRKASNRVLLLGFIGSSLLYYTIQVTNNSFNLGSSNAFQTLLSQYSLKGNYDQFLRLGSVYLSWAIQCLPYIYFSTLLSRWYRRGYFHSVNAVNFFLFWVFFFAVYGLSNIIIGEGLAEIAKGCITLVAAILISPKISKNILMLNLSSSTYGIYFIHWMVTTLFYFIGNRLFFDPSKTPEIFELILSSVFILCLSWLATLLLSKIKLFRIVALGSK